MIGLISETQIAFLHLFHIESKYEMKEKSQEYLPLTLPVEVPLVFIVHSLIELDPAKVKKHLLDDRWYTTPMLKY